MNCPNCNVALPDGINTRINFCPSCGGKLYQSGKKYLIEVMCTGQRSFEGSDMLLFVDDKAAYDLIANEKIVLSVNAGFHSFRFKKGLRSKSIQLLISGNYTIKVYYNTLSGLFETTITEVLDENYEEVFGNAKSVGPMLTAHEKKEEFDTLLGENNPDYVINATSGFREGILRLYAGRCEFSCGDINREVTQYKDMLSVKKKTGSIDIICAGNVHKVYSIPKDIYNEVIAYLNNKIEKIKSGEASG